MEDVSVGEAAYRRVRTDILFGRLTPGQRLGLDWMRQTYGISVSTLRELLSRLSSEDFVTAEGQRGFEVAQVSPADFREVADLRLLLETHAIGNSFAAGGLDWEGHVVAAHHRLAALERRLIAGEASEAEVWKRYDWEFHRALIAACGSRALLQAHAAAYDRYLRYQMVAVVFRGAVAAEEHQRLLECALARDAAAARRVLQTHIESCVSQVLQAGTLEALANGNAESTGSRRRRAEAKPASGASR
ncbi:GntR family transcriptional regulator [Plastoroseomonas arctica]|uniref:GntR family transcriptional regulator n=1 Tax=Plastoroseomonas arctica TaxID=1509237 RepID=A0AAF1JTX4_9PROT|nr:GntR family transcriptional regulator [Plastoroseomonas arctica]MBR0653496.1 GntR family transcriptional regulator [Plastoroseomonas arctica]